MSSVDTSNFDLDFSIPYVTETPTVDEILLSDNNDDFFAEINHLIGKNNEDGGGDDDEDLSNAELLDTSLLIDNFKDDNSNSNINNQFDENSMNRSSSLINNEQQQQHIESSFNISELSFVKQQILQSKSEQIDSGNPTSFVLSTKFIAIGTFNSHILLFESCDNNKLVALLKHSKNLNFGSITSLAINRDSTRLLAGSSRGTISLWNLSTYEMIRIIDDLNDLYCSIISIYFLSNDNYFILNDTSGSIFVMDIRKKHSQLQCIFSGSRGETLVLKPLQYADIPSNRKEFNGIERICLLAMATVSKLIVISIRPAIHIHFTTALQSKQLEYLPLISWNLSFKYRNNELMPLLSFARENQIFIHRMVTDFNKRINFIPLYQFTTTNYMLQHLCWFNHYNLFVIDTEENGHLIDVIIQEELEKIDLSHLEMIYENSTYKSLANGSYVSQAMSMAGQHACNNSICLMNKSNDHSTDDDDDGEQNYQLYILGSQSVYRISIRNWKEKLQYLIDEQRNYLKVLKFLYEQLKLHNNHKNVKYKEEIIEIMKKTLMIYVESSDFRLQLIQNIHNNESKRIVLLNLIQYVSCLDDKEHKKFLINQLFEQIANCNSNQLKVIFIELIEAQILKEKFTFSAILSPLIVRDLIDYYVGKNYLTLLDQLLINIDIELLDIDFLLRSYQQYQLYDTFIYIHNYGMNEFLLPFKELLKLLYNSSIKSRKNLSKNDIIIGNKLLIYLNCMLTCTYYLPTSNQSTIIENKQEHLELFYEYLLLSNSTNDDNDNDDLDVIEILFAYDSIEFLNTLLLGFEYLNIYFKNLCYFQQLIIDKMFKFIIEYSDNQNDDDDDHNSFFIFLGRCLILTTSSNDNDGDGEKFSIKIIDEHFDQLIESLFLVNSMKRFEERQQILIELYFHDEWRKRIDLGSFIQKARQNQMYKLLEQIFREQNDHLNLFQLYIDDEQKNMEIFTLIESILSTNQQETADFIEIIIKNFKYLIKFNYKKSIELFYKFIVEQNHKQQQPNDNPTELFDSIMCQFNEHSQLSDDYDYCKYKFLEQLFIDYDQQRQQQELEQQQQHEQLMNTLKLNSILTLIAENELNQEMFIKLCIKYDQLDAIDVNNCDSNTVKMLKLLKNYNQLKMLNICQQLGSRNGQAYIYETMKQFGKSFEILFEQLKLSIDNNDNFGVVMRNFQIILNFCHRCYNLNVIELEKYWIHLLDYLLKIRSNFNRNIADSNQQQQPLTSLSNVNKFDKLFETLINEMLQHLNLSKFIEIIMEKLLKQQQQQQQQQQTSKSSSSDYNLDREILSLIFDNYNYEKTLLQLTTNILSDEYLKLLENFYEKFYQSKLIKNFNFVSKCELCPDVDEDINVDDDQYTNNNEKNDQNQVKNQEKFIKFNDCSHLIHLNCFKQFQQKKPCKNQCPLCVTTTTTKTMDQSMKSDHKQSVQQSSSSLTTTKPVFNEIQLRILNNLHNNRLRSLII